MLINPNTLSIITTHTCTAACDHCCFTCSPKVKDAIPVKNIHKYIDQATEIKSLKVVVFTGGECFLLGKNLDEVVAHANDNHFATRFVSNGYWATTPQITNKRLLRLVDAGLKEANFSTGPSHAKYVPTQNVQNGAIEAAKLGLNVAVMVEVFDNKDFDYEGFLKNPVFHELIQEKKIKIMMSPWMRFKGEREVRYKDTYSSPENLDSGPCNTILSVLAINPRENLIACCGLTLEEIEELHLGSLKDRTMAEILSETPDDFLKIWIHIKGPDAILNFVRNSNVNVEIPSNIQHICEKCRALYKNQNVRDALRRQSPIDTKKIINEYVNRINRSKFAAIQRQCLDYKKAI